MHGITVPNMLLTKEPLSEIAPAQLKDSECVMPLRLLASTASQKRMAKQALEIALRHILAIRSSCDMLADILGMYEVC